MSDVTQNDASFSAAPAGSRQQSAQTSEKAKRSEPAMLSSEVDVRDFILMLWRRKTLIFLVVATFFVIGWLVLSMVQPFYTAKAMVKIEARKDTGSIELQQLVADLKLDSTVILSEVEVLRSRSLARKVIQDYNLFNDPELNPLLSRGRSATDMSYNQPTKNGSDRRFRSLSIDEANSYQLTNSIKPPEVTDRLMGKIVTNFLDRLDVASIPGSFVIRVDYTSTDPEKAAKMANALVDTYLAQRLDENVRNPLRLTDWLDERLKTLSEQVRLSEEAVEQYRREKGLIAGSRAEVTAQRISELNSQLVVAQARRAETLARLKQIEDAASGGFTSDSLPDVLDSGLVNQLKIRESDIQRRFSELSERYGPKHPTMINVANELVEIRSRLTDEIGYVLESVKNEVEVEDTRFKTLEADLREIEEARGRENQDMIRLRALIREAEANRLIFENFQETNKRSDQQEKLQEPEAEVISYAIIPEAASYPNKPLFLSLSATVALFFAVVVCLLLEKFDNAFRSAGQIEEMMGRPCFALVPFVDKVPQAELGDFIISKPSSSLAEAVRTLRTVLKLRVGDKDRRPKVVSITSSFPGEGKSTLSTWLSRVSAKSGERVVVIDGDLRRPTIHKMMSGRGDKTIVEYLTGQAKLDEIIVKDTVTGLHKIYARSVPNSALDLLDSVRMRNLIDSLRQVYDLVIIDTPACLAVSDARVLATLADQTLYCVHWDRTAREIVSTGVKQFTDIGYDDVAFVLTNVDVSKHSRYGYGDTPYYYAQYKEYYQN